MVFLYNYKNLKLLSMKSLKVMAALLVAAAMTSCSAVNPLAATSNTVGTKCGKASYPVFLSVLTFGGDASINTAAKNAGIKKISHVDVKTTSILGLYGTKTTYVYGE